MMLQSIYWDNINIWYLNLGMVQILFNQSIIDTPNKKIICINDTFFVKPFGNVILLGVLNVIVYLWTLKFKLLGKVHLVCLKKIID